MSKVIGLNYDDVIHNLQDICAKQFDVLHDIWISTHGRDSPESQAPMAALEKSMQVFWTNQIDQAEHYKSTLMNKIEFMGKEAVELERILNLPQQVKELDNDIPLLQLKTALEDLVKEYRDLGNERIQEYDMLQKKEEEICTLLDEPKKIVPLVEVDSSGPKGSRMNTYSKFVPTDEKLEECRTRIKELEILQANMHKEFFNLKNELRILLNECEVHPLAKYERFAVMNEVEGEAFVPFSGITLKKLRETVDVYYAMKRDLIAKADDLRSEISKVSKKLMKDTTFLESLFAKFAGFGKETTEKLRQILNDLVAERKFKLKELILLHRDMLEELWSKCHYSDYQRSQFKAYHADHFSEDILTLHELEAERLEFFYNHHKRIFLLAEKHRELWERLLDLEQKASSSERLFTNRGGRLLLEEKERKTIQKKLPAVKSELVTLLNQFKAEHGVDFLDFGIPLIDALENLEEEHEAAKENAKRQRKAANSETLRLESRLGSQPVASKRKLVAPKSNGTKIMKMSAHSTVVNSTASSAKSTSSNRCQKMQLMSVPVAHGMPVTPVRVVGGASAGSYVMRHTPQLLHVPKLCDTVTPARKVPTTPAASTPNNGSPSYESFQENLMDPSSNRMCQNSTKTEERVLRPRNQAMVQAKTLFKTPSKTPMKTPSRIPFKIATGSKIPSVVPPISPRRGAKLTTPRTRLPIIF